MTELPSLNRRNSEKKRPLGVNDRISLKIKAKLNPMDEGNPGVDGQIKGTFQDLDERYNRERKRRTEIESIEYGSNGTLKLTPPSSSEQSLESATINNIQRKVEFLITSDDPIRDYILKNSLNPECLLAQLTQPFFMLHLLQGLRNQQKLNTLLFKKIQSIHALQKSKSDYQSSESRMEKLLRNRMKFLQKHIE